MNKIILSNVVVTMLFVGCVGTAENMAKDVATDIKSSAIKDANDTKNTLISDVNSTVSVAPPQSSLKDEAIDKAVEIADEHTDGKASVVKEMLVK